MPGYSCLFAAFMIKCRRRLFRSGLCDLCSEHYTGYQFYSHWPYHVKRRGHVTIVLCHCMCYQNSILYTALIRSPHKILGVNVKKKKTLWRLIMLTAGGGWVGGWVKQTPLKCMRSNAFTSNIHIIHFFHFDIRREKTHGETNNINNNSNTGTVRIVFFF